jgi:hypothetical protein
MNVKDIVLEDMVLQAKEGLDFTEASNIKLKNIQLLIDNTDPVASIHNSENISLDQLSYPVDAKFLFNITGEKSRNILVTKTDASKAKSKVEFSYGANNSALQLK